MLLCATKYLVRLGGILSALELGSTLLGATGWPLHPTPYTLAPAFLAAQVPTNVPPPSQAAQALQTAVQQQPGVADEIRQRIAQSGMSPDQVRALLQSRGYSPTLLDQYMGTPAPGQAAPTPGVRELAAIQALGLQPVQVAVPSLPVDTGLIHAVTPGAVQPETTSENTVFGVDVFKRTTTQFLPMLSGPVPADYRLQPGDNLVLVITGDVEQAHSLQVTREGFVLIPQVGQVFVSNLTLDQFRSLLYTRLGRVYSGVKRGPGATTHFDVSVVSVGAAQVYVLGEVGQPGAYQISALGTVLTALYAAGGVTNRADVRQLEVRRAEGVVSRLDLYDYLLHGDARNDVRLQTGDVVFVPLHGTRATVRGAVLRPAIYELKSGETLADLIWAAGGLKPDAALQRLSIQRVLPPDQRTPEGPQRVTIDVPLGKPDSAGAASIIPRFPIEDGDIVTAFGLTSGGRHYVEIRGNVYLPGRFGFDPGMTLSQLVARAGGLRPATFAGRAHIERLNPADSLRRIIPVELPGDSTKPWTDDPQLRDYDVVTIYGRTEMREDLFVSVYGMVNEPRRYPWRGGMTLRDLVLSARGLKMGADLQDAEIARLPADRAGGRMATILHAAMDSTYLFDRDSLGRPIGPPGLAFAARGAPDVPLEPFDAVLILRQPDFEMLRTVSVLGEVKFPGTYALASKGERLASIIERAGGLTARAYPQGVRFVRSAAGAGRINIDLPRALHDTASADNVILQQADSISIPEYEPSVVVTGAVNSPVSVLWKQGEALSYYVRAAGGLSRYAVPGRISVRYANGELATVHSVLLFFSSSPAPGPGSIVFVPARDPNDKTDFVALFGNLAQTLASTMAIFLVVTKL